MGSVAAPEPVASGEPAARSAPTSELTVRRWRDGEWQTAQDTVAEEAPVALVYNSIPHVVMLATPANLADLGVGFTLSEGLVASLDEIRSVQVLSAAGEISGHEVQIAVAAQRFAAILDRRRNLTGRTGCGVCGAETIEDAIRVPPPVAAGGRISREALSAAVRALRASQPLNATVGSLHAAAWCSWEGALQLTREDVGRHNALDKVIGSLAQARADFTAGFAMVTSRASYELVQKAATMGVRMLVAVSGPTALAIRLAQSTGLTLVGFAREQQLVVYAHPERIG